jgi:hypothetical protein
MRRTLLALVALSVVGGATAYGERPPSSPTSDSTTIIVQNDRTKPVAVYLDLGSEEITLGHVNGLDIGTFVVPPWLLFGERSVNVFVHPQGGFDMETGHLELRRGEHLGVLVPEHPIRFPRTLPL